MPTVDIIIFILAYIIVYIHVDMKHFAIQTVRTAYMIQVHKAIGNNNDPVKMKKEKRERKKTMIMIFSGAEELSPVSTTRVDGPS